MTSTEYRNDLYTLALSRLHDAGALVLEDGEIKLPRFVNPHGPWLFVRPNMLANCVWLHEIMFNILLQSTSVPIFCMNCYKVVLQPWTVKELFALRDCMLQLDLPSKIGTEGDRANSDKLYGAYFYCHGFEHGLHIYNLVRRAVLSDPRLPDDMPIILKRSCTEFEQACGSSNRWEISKWQRDYESVVYERFKFNLPVKPQPISQRLEVVTAWLMQAYKWGDASYLELRSGVPFYEPCVTYQPHQ